MGIPHTKDCGNFNEGKEGTTECETGVSVALGSIR